jgi:hypothetical protein
VRQNSIAPHSRACRNDIYSITTGTKLLDAVRHDFYTNRYGTGRPSAVTPSVRFNCRWCAKSPNGTIMSAASRPSRSVEVRPRVSGAVTASTSPTARSSRRASCSSRSIRAPSPRRWPKPAPARQRAERPGAGPGRSRPRAAAVAVEAVSKSDVDRLRARVQAAGGWPRRQARVRARALDVEFTQVRAPIGGRISDRRSMPAIWSRRARGRRHAADHDQRARSDLLHLRRIGGAVPQDQARAAARRDAVAGRDPLQDETDYRWKGRLDFTDNGLDPRRARSAAARCCPIPACS